MINVNAIYLKNKFNAFKNKTLQITLEKSILWYLKESHCHTKVNVRDWENIQNRCKLYETKG